MASHTKANSSQARAAEETVLVVPATDRAAIVVQGKDRMTWLNGLVTCDLAKLAPGHAAYGLVVEKKGRIQTDFVVLQGDGLLALGVPRSLRPTLVEMLEHYLIMEDVDLTTPDLAFYLAHGPRAAALAGLCPLAGTLDLLGSGGVALAVPTGERVDFEAKLRVEVDRLGGLIGDDDGWNATRIARGLPRFGVEVDTSMYPQEASLDKLGVSFTKGCYLGQEVVYMLESRGHVQRKLVALAIDGDAMMPAGAAITTPAGDVAGDIRSAVPAPLGTGVVAIAMVRWAHAKPGTELVVDGRLARVRSGS